MRRSRNCPKYINVRELSPIAKTNPHVVYQNLQLGQDDRLPDELISFIHENDTVFLGTSYVAPPPGIRREFTISPRDESPWGTPGLHPRQTK